MYRLTYLFFWRAGILEIVYNIEKRDQNVQSVLTAKLYCDITRGKHGYFICVREETFGISLSTFNFLKEIPTFSQSAHLYTLCLLHVSTCF